MVFEYIAVFLLAFFGVLSLTPFIIKLANKTNYLDNPEARKMHKKAVPLLGGLSVFLGFLAISIYDVLLATNINFNKPIIGYLVGALIIVIVGLIDDRKAMKPATKMMGQFLSCLIFLYCNDALTYLGPVYISVPILLLWMIGLMNALNFLDNMDGIISGMSGILALGFYAFSFISKTEANPFINDFIALLSLTFAGAIFGFLPFNFNPAKIFLGDAGSMFIGYFLSTMGILTGRIIVNFRSSSLYYLLPILLLSYAIFDISLVSYIRKRDGRRVTEGGKDHSTHRIGNAVGSAKITALIVYLINIIIVLITIILFKMDSEILLILFALIFAIMFLFLGRRLDKVPVILPQKQQKSEA